MAECFLKSLGEFSIACLGNGDPDGTNSEFGVSWHLTRGNFDSMAEPHKSLNIVLGIRLCRLFRIVGMVILDCLT